MIGGASYRSAQARSGRRRLFVATILVLFVFLLDLATGGKLRGYLRAAAPGFSEATRAVGGAVFENGYFSTRAALERELEAKDAEIAQYQEKAAAYDALKAQYDALAPMSRLAQSLPGVTAPIVSSLSASPYGTFLIGAGQGSGIAKGDMVLSSDGFVIGDIASIDPGTSLVSKLFAPGRATDVVIHGASVRLSGEGGSNGKANVPRGIPVADGDAAVAPGFGGRAVGIVLNVASSSASAYSTVLVALPVNLNELRFVYVVRR